MRNQKLRSILFLICIAALQLFVFTDVAKAQLSCGTRTSDENAVCEQGCSLTYLGQVAGQDAYCCGIGVDDQCLPGPVFDVEQGPTNETFDTLNPLVQFGKDYSRDLTTPGGIVSRLLAFALPIAGMILFIMLVWGGFEILASSAGQKSLDAGKQRITAAVVGFILLFVSYWIMQILEIIFGVSIV